MTVVGKVRHPDDELSFIGELGMYQRNLEEGSVRIGFSVKGEPFKAADGKYLEVQLTWDPSKVNPGAKELVDAAVPRLIEAYQAKGYAFGKDQGETEH